MLLEMEAPTSLGSMLRLSITKMSDDIQSPTIKFDKCSKFRTTLLVLLMFK